MKKYSLVVNLKKSFRLIMATRSPIKVSKESVSKNSYEKLTEKKKAPPPNHSFS